ncbi:MAG: pentapeptide repeat-containing protein [Okeania sp. SIO3I5]|uniref:pentapeptide repeat-containing protein n=1 Tax=Okeania sp. SIO3I5 TaxID=2607805 RepID=UPI0013B72D6B|nr:pentapeptide repeat-containing protein [Okeania sp. SIO3I5]NEQ40732.1 pentapeptide repeat-containing protein [Okeania sp. SIO3I5]
MLETKGNLSKQKKREKKSVEEIIEEYKKGERNFSNLDLRGQSFAGYNLSGANFTGCNLRGADFTGCDLKGTSFRRARMVKAILHDIKAGSENDRTTYTWFFALLLFATALIIWVIGLLVFSREGEIDIINENANSFFSLAILVPVGYLIHLSNSQGNIALVFWGLGILDFWLKTFYEPLSGIFGNILFWGLAVSLLSPIYRFSMSKSWRSLGQLFQNFPVLIILSFLFVGCVVISFSPIDLVDLLKPLGQLDPLNLVNENNWLLILSSITFNLPVISLLFLSLAAYSTLFDANNRETYSNIFKAFFRLGFSGLALLFVYSWSRYSLVDILDIDDLIILILVIALQLIVIVKLWQLIQAKKIRILKLIFWVSSILFYCYYCYKENILSYLDDLNSTTVIEKITFIIIVCLLSLLVLLIYYFANLSWKSKSPAKWLGWWYFINLVLPTSLISMFVFISPPDLYWFRDNNYWLSFFVPTLSIWLIFLLSVSFFDIHKFRNLLKERVKKQWSYHFLIFLWFTLFVLFTSYLVVNSINILIFFINLLEDGELYFYSILDSGGYEFIFVFVLVILALSFVSWLILIFTKNKIAETKHSSFQLQKIKSQYSIFRDLAVFFRCINSTNFGEANLTEADFSGAELTSVNFRGAKLNYTIWTQVKGLECVATGNTYLKYPKVRNWVVQVKNDIKSP